MMFSKLFFYNSKNVFFLFSAGGQGEHFGDGGGDEQHRMGGGGGYGRGGRGGGGWKFVFY